MSSVPASTFIIAGGETAIDAELFELARTENYCHSYKSSRGDNGAGQPA
jgi:hypothetical protein